MNLDEPFFAARIELEVNTIDEPKINCTVKSGGELSNNKGINRRGGGLSAGALTDKDREDLKAAAAMQVDYLAISFVRNASDIREARRLLDETNCTAGIIAKIERAEAVEAIDVLERQGYLNTGDMAIITKGDQDGYYGVTNAMKIVEVGQVV